VISSLQRILARASSCFGENQDDALVRSFERDGFVLGGPVLAREEVELLARELERFIDTLFRDRDRGVTSPATASLDPRVRVPPGTR
jgi:hypothetical protein